MYGSEAVLIQTSRRQLWLVKDIQYDGGRMGTRILSCAKRSHCSITNDSPSVSTSVPNDVPLPSVKCGMSWEHENILVLGQRSEILALAVQLDEQGAEVSCQYMQDARHLYYLPLEHYSLAIIELEMNQTEPKAKDLARILRRACSGIQIILASETFKFSVVGDTAVEYFFDIQLALPTSAAQISKLLG